jgi:hypothetical protein
MSYLLALLIVLSVTAVAAAASFVTGRRVGLETRRRYHDVGLPVFAQLGLLLSVLIAFVFSGVWSDYRTADEAMGGERSALHGAAILAHGLPDHRGEAIERSIAVYAQIVATDEWREMTRRKLSRNAQRGFEEIIRQAASDASSGSVSPQVRAQILTLVMQAHDQRETRTYQLTQSVPPFIWVTLIVLFLLQLTFLVFAGVEHPVNLIFAAAFAGCTVLVLVSISLLDFPFEGALALSNADFVQLSEQIDELIRSGPGGTAAEATAAMAHRK